MHKALFTPLVGRQTPPEVKAWTVRKYASRLAYLDDTLKGREFLLDRFSVADAYLATILNWTQATPEIDLGAYPNVKAYLERMRARPSVAAAMGLEAPAVPGGDRAEEGGLRARCPIGCGISPSPRNAVPRRGRIRRDFL